MKKRSADHTSIMRAVGAFALLLLLASCGGPEYRELQGRTMGTTWSVKLNGGDSEALQAAIEAELAHINKLMSTYDPASELSLFNQSAVGEAQAVSDELLNVLAMARQIHTDSNGAFDVTIGPVVNLWGFGPDPAEDEVPPASEIDAALKRVGDDALSWESGALSRSKDVYVDLSAIAKGYAVDRVAEILKEAGVADYLVEIGGELKAAGQSPRGGPWRIAVEKPDPRGRAIQTTLPLVDAAMATSGDYRNYFEVDGVRYSHMIDARDGRPITHSVASVTVIAESSALADGYATALNVMGLEAGMALAEANAMRVLVIIKGPEGFEEKQSSAMAAYLAQ